MSVLSFGFETCMARTIASRCVCWLRVGTMLRTVSSNVVTPHASCCRSTVVYARQAATVQA